MNPVPSGTARDAAALARWLLFVAALVVLIVAVGGVTRLTESGVSITEWKPVTGAVPPLTEPQWQAEFDAYRRTPQYTEINGPAGMTLEGYKFIYFWEWLHRLLARAIGGVLALVTIMFALRRRLPAGYGPRLIALVALVGLQGAIGWWMVKSGIVNDVKVSHFRLAAHLLTALLTLGGLVWIALDLTALSRGAARSKLTGFAAVVLSVLTVQLFLGALVAGLRAGHVANDWPLMQGHLFPQGVDWSLGPGHALFNDPYLLHFAHRWWAWAVVAVLIVAARRLKRQGSRLESAAIHCAFGVQIILGIFTVWSGVSLWFAVAHQLVGALLVAATVGGMHALGRRP